MFDLKPISREAIPAAIEKAKQYRLLNEPREAESICRDILRVDEGNADATVILLLALTDQFGKGWRVNVNHAQGFLGQLPEGYSREYYAGVICERWAKCLLGEESPGHVVFEWIQQAMEHFEKAIDQAPSDNDEAKLRWNTCARMIKRNPQVSPRPEEQSRETAAGFEDEVPLR